MKIFLTGINGYLGGVLTDHLNQVPEVELITGIDVVPPQATLPYKVKFIQMDIRSPDLARVMAGHDVVIHTAFIVLWLAKMSAEERNDINLNGIRNVAQAAVANKVRHVIHTSSAAAYELEKTAGKEGITEDYPTGTGESGIYYPDGKALAERKLIAELDSAGITYTIFRPIYIIGPRNTELVDYLVNDFVHIRGLNPRTQYVHEDDVAAAHIQALGGEMTGVYNIVPDDSLHASEVMKIIGRESVPVVPPWLARMIIAIKWRFFGGSVHTSWIDMSMRTATLSNAKLRATGWSPRYTCEEAIRSAFE